MKKKKEKEKENCKKKIFCFAFFVWSTKIFDQTSNKRPGKKSELVLL